MIVDVSGSSWTAYFDNFNAGVVSARRAIIFTIFVELCIQSHVVSFGEVCLPYVRRVLLILSNRPLRMSIILNLAQSVIGLIFGHVV